jgi:hypothetical protein
MNSHLKTIALLVFLSDYMNQIHYIATDHHMQRHSFKGEHHHVHHIIHMTHAKHFGLYSEAMSVHARLAK